MLDKSAAAVRELIEASDEAIEGDADVKIHEYQAKEILKKSASPSRRGGRRSAPTRRKRPPRR